MEKYIIKKTEKIRFINMQIILWRGEGGQTILGAKRKLIYKGGKFGHATQELFTAYSFKQLKAGWGSKLETVKAL